MAHLGKTEALCNASNISVPFFNFKKTTNFLVEKVFFSEALEVLKQTEVSKYF